MDLTVVHSMTIAFLFQLKLKTNFFLQLHARQVNPNLYTSIVNGWTTIGKAEGVRGLFTGWLPTSIGYSMQGLCKFGFYEYFKKQFTDLAGQDVAHKYRTSLYLAASASAEVVADVALCPMEALKVRMQTSATPFASSTMAGAAKIYAAEGFGGFYKGLSPLWMRQVSKRDKGTKYSFAKQRLCHLFCTCFFFFLF